MSDSTAFLGVTRDAIGIDFETYCILDLKVVGLRRYVEHPSFRVLLCSMAVNEGTAPYRWDFVLGDYVQQTKSLKIAVRNRLNEGFYFSAHNSGFEQAVLRTLGIFVEDARMVDSAEVGRSCGAESRLALAARQLLGSSKLEEGADLINKYCKGPTPPTADDVRNDPDWVTFGEYCDRDAVLSKRLMQYRSLGFGAREQIYSGVTHRMNDRGWHVDMDLVNKMQIMYQDNVTHELRYFRKEFDPNSELNFNSPVQLTAWCKERGIIATSFTEDKVVALRAKINHKLSEMLHGHPRWKDYTEVLEMLATKQILGGSSLSKLQTIKDLVADDGRLHDQYVHVGAGQSYRTSGRGVQMQNLKRLPQVPDDVRELIEHPSVLWTNDKLAKNLRQVFTAEDPKGLLIVGDFASIEARGLAWLAGAQWKLDAFAKGKDMYKVLAGQMYHMPYEAIDKGSIERQAGKVGELACGYQAGGPTVSVFANKLGVDMDVDDATQLVRKWREVNVEIVRMWAEIDYAMKRLLLSGASQEVILAGGRATLQFYKGPRIVDNPTAITMGMRLQQGSQVYLERVFPGVYLEGQTIRYHKATRTIKGSGWADHFWDRDQKKDVYYTLYGGKVTGILTQSLCREMFFAAMVQVEQFVNVHADQLMLIGQFHDEMVLEYKPGSFTSEFLINEFKSKMEYNWLRLDGFPIAADIKFDYRYTK